ncbi:methyltransferase domain-containing protein [Xanthomonas sp. BRIP62415]|uniref:methyltransferase domain-containing protein n=1 Tax=Xanthomonas sp. BRIP62415 TaxID=2182390 RepID=UPI000F8E050E|nr:methyltransferase domain-containing protein [Xanthomonas sp. BRIP62415]
MIDSLPSVTSSISDLVAALPEKYQPIFGHPELSEDSSRSCEDRLELILDVAGRLQTALERPARILDLGCAQGFFSLNLAARGFIVHGVDFLDRNVAVCQALAREQGSAAATFECGRIEEIVGRLEHGRYDLVLGLSVFHHLIHEHGLEPVVDLVGRINSCIPIGIYELAVREEPLYWAPSQPADPAELLQRYALLRVLAHQVTHLSGITRPLYYASSHYWLLGEDFRQFDTWRSESHANAMNSHAGTRRYYFAEGVLLKKMSLVNPARRNINLTEYENEVSFLRMPPPGVTAPSLMAHLQDSQDVWILRQQLAGRLLSELIEEKAPYAYEEVADTIIAQLVALEAAGLYHNDIRCWNLLLDDAGRIAFIDYGAVSTEAADCVWPNDLLLSLLITLREIVHGQVSAPLPVRRPLLDISMLPARYRDAFHHVLALPQENWTYRALHDALGLTTSMPEQAGWLHVLRKQEGALLIYERSARHLQSELEGLKAKLNESLSNAHRWYLQAGEGDRIREELNETILSLNEVHSSDNAKMNEVRRRLQATGVSFATLREQIEDVRAQLNSSLQNAHHWYLRASVAEQNLHAVHATTSWRLTRPLRGMARLARGPRASIRRIMVALIRRVLKRPAFARMLNRALRNSPPLHSKIRALATSDMLIERAAHAAPQHVSIVGHVIDTTALTEHSAASQLSSRGLKFYGRMLTARNTELV